LQINWQGALAMKYTKAQTYDKQFLLDNMMGPNAIKMLEELTELPGMLELKPDMRVLDLGCGRGLTSIFLAKEFGVQVFATDLWITASENFARFKEAGLEHRIIPIHADAPDLPYADEYFNVIISIDAYHYFGREEAFVDEKMAPLLKQGGKLAIAVPGLKKEIHNDIPHEMLLSWDAKAIETLHSPEWWRELLSKSERMELQAVGELECYQECWNDWLECSNEYAILDRKAMEGGAGKHMDLVFMIAAKR
jgi:cyclopropane fatty-acyl-phospholipid synthase-like methyltransferase